MPLGLSFWENSNSNGLVLAEYLTPNSDTFSESISKTNASITTCFACLSILFFGYLSLVVPHFIKYQKKDKMFIPFLPVKSEKHSGQMASNDISSNIYTSSGRQALTFALKSLDPVKPPLRIA